MKSKQFHSTRWWITFTCCYCHFPNIRDRLCARLYAELKDEAVKLLVKLVKKKKNLNKEGVLTIQSNFCAGLE